MAEFFGKGISVGSGFDLGANLPLDNRTVQATLADRDSMPTIQLVEGLFVYVKENKTAYILKGFDPDGSNRVWETLATGTVVEIINSLESDRTDAALSAAQGKALKTAILKFFRKMQCNCILIKVSLKPFQRLAGCGTESHSLNCSINFNFCI